MLYFFTIPRAHMLIRILKCFGAIIYDIINTNKLGVEDLRYVLGSPNIFEISYYEFESHIEKVQSTSFIELQ